MRFHIKRFTIVSATVVVSMTMNEMLVMNVRVWVRKWAIAGLPLTIAIRNVKSKCWG